MRHHPERHLSAANLLTLAGLACLCLSQRAEAQIYLNPSQQTMTRSRVSIDMGDGLRCSSDGGSVATMGLSVGAYPDQWGNDNIVVESGRSISNNNQSSLLGLLSIHIPLERTSQAFDCKALLQDAQFKARLANLRELLEEDILNETQYREAVLRLYDSLTTPQEKSKTRSTAMPPPRRGAASVTIDDKSAPAISLRTPTPAAIPMAATTLAPSPPPLPPLPEAGGSLQLKAKPQMPQVFMARQ